MSKDLKDKAIKIKGKDYVLVSDRVLFFNETYPNGAIETSYVLDNDTYIVTATVTPDVDKPVRRFVDHSQAVIGDGMVNKAAALENASTSAVGRALAYMGIGVIESIASADEMNKAISSGGMRYATEKQINWVRQVTMQELNVEPGDVDEVIQEILTVPVQKIPLKKVADAVDLIKSKRPKDKPLDTSGVNLTDEDLKAVEEGTFLNDVPY